MRKATFLGFVLVSVSTLFGCKHRGAGNGSDAKAVVNSDYTVKLAMEGDSIILQKCETPSQCDYDLGRMGRLPWAKFEQFMKVSYTHSEEFAHLLEHLPSYKEELKSRGIFVYAGDGAPGEEELFQARKIQNLLLMNLFEMTPASLDEQIASNAARNGYNEGGDEPTAGDEEREAMLSGVRSALIDYSGNDGVICGRVSVNPQSRNEYVVRSCKNNKSYVLGRYRYGAEMIGRSWCFLIDLDDVQAGYDGTYLMYPDDFRNTGSTFNVQRSAAGCRLVQ